MIFWLGVAMLVIIPLVLLNRRMRAGGEPVEDPDELARAEHEVRDLDAFASPEDAQQDLPDWGPGVPH